MAKIKPVPIEERNTFDIFHKAFIKVYHTPQEPSKIPLISRDGKYVPSEEAINKALAKLEAKKNKPSTKLIYDTSDKTRDYGEDFWKRVNDQKDKYLINRRIKKRKQKEAEEERKFRLARAKAKEYYIHLKELSLSHQKYTLPPYLKENAQRLRTAQRQQFTGLLHYLREENYRLADLYEDYPMYRHTKKTLRMDPLLHENLYRNLFLFDLHKRHYGLLHTFLSSQRCERFLQFLWHLKTYHFFNKEVERLNKVRAHTGHPYFIC